jgi:hypothetical protein
MVMKIDDNDGNEGKDYIYRSDDSGDDKMTKMTTMQ